MICVLPLKKQIFCWCQDPQNPHVPPHGLAIGEDGVMLGLCPQNTPTAIMEALSYQHQLFDLHFGSGNWELIFVPKNEVDEVGLNIPFEAALSKNQLLAQKAGLNK